MTEHVGIIWLTDYCQSAAAAIAVESTQTTVKFNAIFYKLSKTSNEKQG